MVLAFDACNMDNIEALSHFNDHAGILIASEIPEPATGYPYDEILKKIKDNPSLCSQELSKYIVEENHKYYVDSHRAAKNKITLTAFDCKKFPEFFNKVGDLAKEMTLYIELQGVGEIESCIKNTYLYTDQDIDPLKEGYIDLKGLSLNLLEADLPSAVKKAAQALADFYENSGLVIESKVPGGKDRPNGLSIYAPPPDEFKVEYLKNAKSLPPGIGRWSWFLGMYYIKIPGKDAAKNPLVAAIGQTMAEMVQKGEYRI